MKASRYIISLDKNDFNDNSVNCIGKINSNFNATESVIYDNGQNPKDKYTNQSNARKELGFIKYVN